MISQLVSRAFRARAFSLLLLFALPGCSGLVNLPGSGPAPDLYDLTPKSSFAPESPAVNVQLVIEVPTAPRGLDTDRIALRPAPTQLQYFAGSRWSDRAPKMVQTLLVESFENSGKIVAVGPQAVGLRSDYVLKTDLREFQAEYFKPDTPPEIRVRLNLKLIKMPDARIVASQNFERVIAAPGNNTIDIVNSFDEALGKVLRRSVEWSLQEIDRTATPVRGG